MITLIQIQERLIEAIRNSVMSQSEISKKLGVRQQTVSHYANGDIMPALDTFANLCVILDVNPAEILCVEAYQNS